MNLEKFEKKMRFQNNVLKVLGVCISLFIMGIVDIHIPFFLLATSIVALAVYYLVGYVEIYFSLRREFHNILIFKQNTPFSKDHHLVTFAERRLIELKADHPKIFAYLEKQARE